MTSYALNAFCGIEMVGEAMALETNQVKKYQEYPTLEESTVGEDESLEDDPQNDDPDVVNREGPASPVPKQQQQQEQPKKTKTKPLEEEEPENTFSRLVVCYNRSDGEDVDPVDPIQDENNHSYYTRPDRCGSTSASALCASTFQYPESPRAPSNRLNQKNTREILNRSGSFLDRTGSKQFQLLQTHHHHHQEYPQDAPNLLEDCDFEILAPQDTLDEGQAEEVQVLNPDIMEDLQSHLPLTKKGESFWLQYSLIRDGASMDSLLYKIRNTDHCVLAIETVDGDVFGAYTSRRWRYHDDFFGSRDAFLWRKNPDPQEGVEDVQCYHYSYLNQDVQLCTHDRLAVGGGIRKFDPEYGFGISLDRDLLTGTTSKSMTFLNPPLSSKHADGSTFEVRNIEVWALTPCLSLEDAERVAERVQNKPIWA